MSDANEQVKFEEWMKGGFELCKENAQVLVISAVVAAIVSGLSFGLLAGPMMAGMVLMVLRLVDKQEPKPVVGDLFKGFSYFLPTFLLFLACGMVFGSLMVLGMIPFIGFIARILTPVAFAVAGPFLTLAVFLIVAKNMGVVDAVKESVDMMMKVLPNLFIFLLLTSIISGLGLIACCVGVFFTIPMSVCMQAMAYRAFYPVSSSETPASTPMV